MGGVAPTDILDVIEGYDGEGYGIADRELKGIYIHETNVTYHFETTYTLKLQ